MLFGDAKESVERILRSLSATDPGSAASSEGREAAGQPTPV